MLVRVVVACVMLLLVCVVCGSCLPCPRLVVCWAADDGDDIVLCFVGVVDVCFRILVCAVGVLCGLGSLWICVVNQVGCCSGSSRGLLLPPVGRLRVNVVVCRGG